MHASGATEREHKDGKAPPSTTVGAPSNKVLNKVHEPPKLPPFSLNHFYQLKSASRGPNTVVSHDDYNILPWSFRLPRNAAP